MRLGSLVIVLIVGGFAAVRPVSAQTQRSGGGESQKMMQQYQQLASERSAWQAQLAQMKKELDTANADLAAAKRERDALKTAVAGSAAVVAQANRTKLSVQENLDQSKQRMTELVARFRETVQNLKEIETDRNAARKELTERSAAFEVCAADNLQLFEITRDVLNRYEHVGLFSRVAASEPFTQITRTRTENLVDQYRARAEELRVKQQSH